MERLAGKPDTKHSDGRVPPVSERPGLWYHMDASEPRAHSRE